MNAVNIPLEEFIRPFFDSADIVRLRIFDDRKGGTFKGAKLECEAGRITQLAETLRKHNAQNRGIFFVVNSGGDRDEDISRINAVFVENDSLSIDEQAARLEGFALPPSLMVKTAKSVHAYWLVKDVKVTDFRFLQKRLIAQFDGDTSCVNESRVLRLPGFFHCKGDSVMVECIKFAPELRYTMAELEAALPKIPGETSAAAPIIAQKGMQSGLALVGKRCEFIKYCKANPATLPEALWYAMISNLAVFSGGDRAIHALSKGYPDYSYTETKDKIAHYLSSGTKPITCAKIADGGFQCPKLDTAECGCKSPAGLCYQPLTIDELLEKICGLEKRPTPIENIQLLREFILENLYNIEPILAETLISHNIREHFSLKLNDVKPLISLHRDTYRRYANSKETKREASGAELPEWYEITERGGIKFLPGILADYMAKDVNAFFGAGAFYFYVHGVYEMRDEIDADAAVRGFMISRHAKSADISDAMNQWRMQIKKTVREINANPFIINVRNGLYNVLDSTFKPHTPEYYSTVQLNADYSPSAQCPLFQRFISGILPEKEAALMQEIFGYLLIPINKAQKSFVFVGAPNAGKSTLLSIAQEVLLGSENVSNIPWQGLGERFNKAELFGKLANIFADLPSKAIDDGGMFKSLTGEDYISAERKNKNPFNFQPYARLLFSCILMWALEGLRRLIKNNYVFSETARTKMELQRYKVESNSALLFMEECCEIKENAEVPREQFFERYRDFCCKNGMKAMSQTNFNRDVEASEPSIKKAVDKLGKRRTWRGIRLID